MKEKTLTTMPLKIFCPNCHKEIDNPVKGIIFSGSINVLCGRCKNGKIILDIKNAQDQKKSI